MKIGIVEINELIDKEIESEKQVNSQIVMGMVKIKESLNKLYDEKEAQANKQY
ncbi:hypothetical protein [Alkaliphilus sp. B6464]|uniref:hypothetical protein n=1 Tax=Alkaliphilus sp. B6464 TaxID=2731219 RepID=UPI001BAE1750|nr:hypothetical protein [Alkaliphilus sp. B6464]QUH21949.1 hypothetical protein HYG84_18760 [Alkaliphilus sp. B6464]